MKSTGAWSSNESQWLDLTIGHQGSSLSNGNQGNISLLGNGDIVLSTDKTTMVHLFHDIV